MEKVLNLRESLKEKKEKGQGIIVAYLPAAYPDLKTSLRWLELLLVNGVDAVELGYPYGAARMDGDTIRKAHQQSLANGFTKESYLAIIQQINDKWSDRLIAMGYWQQLKEDFKTGELKGWLERGLQYLLFPDLDLSDGTELSRIKSEGFQLIPFINQLSNDLKFEYFQEAPFIYCPAYQGKTGKSGKIDKDHLLKLKKGLIDKFNVEIPLQVGFGISKGEEAARIMELGYDGVIIGTAMLRAFQEGEEKALSLLEDIKAGLGVK